MDGQTAGDGADRRLYLAACGLLLASLLIGGTSRPLNDLLVALAALPALYFVLVSPKRPRLQWTAKLALGLWGLALLQLIPLPPSAWTALPGRTIAQEALQAVGAPVGWRPLALDPGAAAMGLATLLSPIMLHIAVTQLSWRQVRRMLALLAGFALASALVGIAQRLSGGFALYDYSHLGDSIGLFTNRNHHADLIIAGLLLLTALLPADQVKRHRLALSAGLIVLALSVIATTSRAGLALAAPATLAALAIVWRPRPKQAALLGMAAVSVGIALLFIPAFSEIFGRFGVLAQDQRVTMARDTYVATQAMWPFGSGYGSFVPVYMSFEDLDMIEARYVIAAHNEYLQLALEGGLPGVLTVLAGVGAVGVLGWKLFNSASPALSWGAWGVCVVLLAHSAFDYPMRTGALAAVFALCTAAVQVAGRRLPHGQ